MKNKQQWYRLGSYRVYDDKAYDEFQAVCREHNTSATRVINHMIKKVAETKKIEAII